MEAVKSLIEWLLDILENYEVVAERDEGNDAIWYYRLVWKGPHVRE
jgi:hypothetical protein